MGEQMQSDLTSATIALVVGGWLMWAEHRKPGGWKFCMVSALWFCLWGILALVFGRQITSVIHVGLSGWYAHLAWKRRPPRKRRPSKVLGRVRDLGHKLAVSHG